jgi:hypothetical protein
LSGEFLYSQVPPISGGECGMLDLLTLDRDGWLVVALEVKAGEDMHLPLQGLDYWIRVRALNAERQVIRNREVEAFERQAYFAWAEISARPPKLLLIAPALRIHPSNEIAVSFFAPGGGGVDCSGRALAAEAEGSFSQASRLSWYFQCAIYALPIALSVRPFAIRTRGFAIAVSGSLRGPELRNRWRHRS